MEDVQVATIEFCCDGDCSFSEDLHLVVALRTVPLKHGQAIAISYTWGEFNRVYKCIGHTPGGAAVTMQLGEEWKIDEVIATLANIGLEEYNGASLDQEGSRQSEEDVDSKSACWIDQISIVQDDEHDDRKINDKIPKI